MSDSTESVQDRWEAFAMQAEKMSGERKWFEVESVGAAIGMSAAESSKVADVLIDADWLTRHPAPASDKVVVRMTKTGFDEVAKLRQPRPVRWLLKHAALIALVVSMIALLVGVAGLLRGFF